MPGEETKNSLVEFLINAASLGLMKAKNEADEEEKTEEKTEVKNEEKDETKEDPKAANEVVDKRDIIRQIMAIAGKEEASEDVKTIAKLAEKLAYDKSEAKTADNNDDEDGKKDKAQNKCKNEDDVKEKEYTDFKKEIDKTAENKKAANSLDEMKKIFYEGTVQNPQKYMSQKDGIELGKKLY